MDERLFSTWVRRAREALDKPKGAMTQAAFAALQGCSQALVARRESGAIPLGETALRSAAEACGVSLEEFVIERLLEDEPTAKVRAALVVVLANAKARRLSGEPSFTLSEFLTFARLSRGVTGRQLREIVPGVDRALGQGSNLREPTLAKVGEALGLSVHELLVEGLLYDPARAAAECVDQDNLRARVNTLFDTGDPATRPQKRVADIVGLAESNLSRFRRTDGRLDEENARKLLAWVAMTEHRLGITPLAAPAPKKAPEAAPIALAQRRTVANVSEGVAIRVGRFVLVRHGKSEVGQVAVVEGREGDLVTVRTWHAVPREWAANTKAIASRDVIGVPDKDDPRVAEAKKKRRRSG